MVIQYRCKINPLFPLSRRELESLVECILSCLGMDGYEFELLVVNDRDMAGFNQAFLELQGPTNVLAFEPEDEDSLGQIILNQDQLEREAFLYGQEPKEHTVRLLAHAILHLAGHDHGEVMYELNDMAVSGCR